MTEAEILAEAVRRIRARFDPVHVILFGSRATGTARADSDFDLLVVLDDAGDWRAPGDILFALFDLPARFEVLVESTANWRKWRGVRPTLLGQIADHGREIGLGAA